MKTILTVLATLTCASALCAQPAFAQYYDRQYERPPGYDPGFYPDRDRLPPGYEPDRDRPPPGYEPDRDRYERGRYNRNRRVALGSHCEAFVRTGYGPQRLFCPIVRAKPIGEECACPADGSDGYVGGRTVR